MTPQFVTGPKRLDEWDAFVEHIQSMGLDEILETYQAAYERYMSK